MQPDLPGQSGELADPPAEPGPSLRARMSAFWRRHRTLFWSIHSVWALSTGVVVILLARERYGFVPWVVAFLGITWASTLFFGRLGLGPADADDVPGLGHELTSYVTRGLYQETLFFLLPFYAYSTVPGSPNVVFLVLLGGLAVFASLDLSFDRLLRTSPVFGMVFFATVAFAATNLLLPMLLTVSPRRATALAALIAVGSSVPLAIRATLPGRRSRTRLGAAAVVILGVAIGAPALVPPVPVRLDGVVFASGIDRETLELADSLPSPVTTARLEGRLIAMAYVFAPSSVPTRVTVQWKRDGRNVRISREIEILAHGSGFRVWDALQPDQGALPPGRYEVILRTAGRRVFGIARQTVLAREPSSGGASASAGPRLGGPGRPHDLDVARRTSRRSATRSTRSDTAAIPTSGGRIVSKAARPPDRAAASATPYRPRKLWKTMVP